MKKLLVIPLLLILACSGMGRRGALADGPVEFQVILAGPYSQAESYSVDLITSDQEWQDTWVKARGNEDPLPPRPTVDFGKEYVIAVFMGTRPSSGFKIEVTSLEKKGDTLKVNVKKYETPGMLPVVTHPFSLIRVPKGKYQLEVNIESVQ